MTIVKRHKLAATVVALALAGVAQAQDGPPSDWLDKMAGRVFVGVHAWLVSKDDVDEDVENLSADYFDGNLLIGSKVADGRATALTDLRIHSDGFSRLLLINDGMPHAQAGRVLQRLLEIETYRMMTLLALPVAQQLTPDLDADERELTAFNVDRNRIYTR